MLSAEIPVPPVIQHRGPTFGRIFHSLLAAAAPHISIESTDFDVLKEEYPDADELRTYDAIIVSGSAASAYDPLPWIHALEKFLVRVYEEYPKIKLFGSCFGHQIVCQALLGALVEPDPNGWELGIQEIDLAPEFQRSLSPPNSSMRLQFIHADHVVLPDQLPSGWMRVGTTKHCAVQGVYEEGRVFTLQGHFEFDKFVNQETVKWLFGETWAKDRVWEALQSMEGADDAILVAEMIVQFFVAGSEKLARRDENVGKAEAALLGESMGVVLDDGLKVA